MTRKRNPVLRAAVSAVVLWLSVCGLGAGQRLPAGIERHVEALGPRVREAGKEQTVYSGELIDESGKRSHLQIVHQLPALIRIEAVNAGRRARLAFDGERGSGVLTPADDVLLEAFVADSPEGFFASLEGNAAMRVLGRRFGPDPRTHPGYKGPRFDIYEVTAPVPSRSDGLVRMKFYYFDSDTGLLHSTRYDDRTAPTRRRIETRFSAWGRVDGSLYPGRIERYEDDRLVFSFVTATVAGGPRLDPVEFR